MMKELKLVVAGLVLLLVSCLSSDIGIHDFEVVVISASPNHRVDVAEVDRFMRDFGFPKDSRIVVRWMSPWSSPRDSLAWTDCPSKDSSLCDGRLHCAVVNVRPGLPRKYLEASGLDGYNEVLSHELWHTEQCLVGGADFNLIGKAVDGLLSDKEAEAVFRQLEGFEEEASKRQEDVSRHYQFIEH